MIEPTNCYRIRNHWFSQPAIWHQSRKLHVKLWLAITCGKPHPRLIPRGALPRTQKLRSRLMWAQGYRRFPLFISSEVDQNIALPADRTSTYLVSAFLIHSASFPPQTSPWKVTLNWNLTCGTRYVGRERGQYINIYTDKTIGNSWNTHLDQKNQWMVQIMENIYIRTKPRLSNEDKSKRYELSHENANSGLLSEYNAIPNTWNLHAIRK